MACVMNGNKALGGEHRSGYQIYQGLELINNKEPISKKKYNDWIAGLTAHARERLPEIIREARQYKCYVL